MEDQSKRPQMDHDLVQCVEIAEKARISESYAQNLYAALCNNEFQRQEVWALLQDQRWSCTWRAAGSIVSDVRGDGDYLDWYCSGMGFWSKDDDKIKPGYVPEGMITTEIQTDLARIGWEPVADSAKRNPT